MIQVRNLKKSFADNTVWSDVSLEIQDGETIAIIGRSGCGKSVLIKHFIALLYPDKGEVYIDDQNVFQLPYTELRKVRQRFGVLFQGSALFDSINTFENIAFPLRYFTDQSEEKIRENVHHALKMVNLEGVGQKQPSELSGGMRKRVGVARAIVHEPDYIMYDEPTSGLDPQTSDEINDLIMDMAENLDITSIVVTHDMHSVLKIAERVAFLDHGQLSWLGPIEELKSTEYTPLTNFIKASEYQITSNPKKENV